MSEIGFATCENCNVSIMRKLGLQPQDLTVMDPACGSGHILVYAFDLLFEIYKEQGYPDREIPGLILEHNLHGLDIDARAVQLASFAVLMKARAKNSRLFRDAGKIPTLNIVMVKSTKALLSGKLAATQPVTDWKQQPEQLSLLPGTKQLGLGDVQPEMKGEDAGIFSLKGLVRSDWQPLLEAFAEAENLGSLITPPGFDGEKLLGQVAEFERENSLFGAGEAAGALREVVRQAGLLRRQYWVVVANPPYMGSGGFNPVLKNFIDENYKEGKGDLYGVYITRNLQLGLLNSIIAMLTIPNWMFLSSFEDLRKNVIQNHYVESLVHNGRGVFGSDFGSCSFTIRKQVNPERIGIFKRLFDKQGSVAGNEELEQRFHTNKNYHARSVDFGKIPGSPIAYWVSQKILSLFDSYPAIKDVSEPKSGLSTTDNDRFLRYWQEVDFFNLALDVEDIVETSLLESVWYPFSKGGEFRKWYGNNEYIVNWRENGQDIKDVTKGAAGGRIVSPEFYFKLGVTWSGISSSESSMRIIKNSIFGSGGKALFTNYSVLYYLGFLNSVVALSFLRIVSPTLNFEAGHIGNIPIKVIDQLENGNDISITKLIDLSKADWNNFETSWDFQNHPILRDNLPQLSQAFTTWKNQSDRAFQELKQLEENNNRYWIEAYGLQSELTPEVPDDQITIRRAELDRDIRSLISYAVGCMMGRYSLDTPGLIHAGQPFDPSRHTTFPADQDAILPITDQAYFDDDIVTRFIDFIATAYSKAKLSENLDFIANALKLKTGETARDRIRRYFLTEFITDHIKTYKKRPIYWLFTSGKKRAFSALVYLHRYSPDTLARLRTDYVLELQVKLDQEIDRLTTEEKNATSTPTKKAATTRLKTLQAQQLELRDYQAKLQTVADQRIAIDLDDGVAYNYTRFKGLVYEGSDLKMADLEAKAQWKLDLLKKQGAGTA